MERGDREFLELLGYLYLQYGKSDEARIIYAALFELADEQPLLTMTYAYCLVQAGQYAVALHLLETIDLSQFSPKERSAFLLLHGNVFWHLGRDAEARRELDRFLAIEKDRTLTEPTRHSFLTRAASKRGNSPIPAKGAGLPTAAPDKKTVGASLRGTEGIWKRVLRFIARKELDREHSR
ncbi:MAG: hypothetical protein LBS68_01885 [Puniceicoccales bacterium]|nr:hypothetical protein [Puniceicoccales bacterium]